MDWAVIIASEPAEEEEMSSLASEFAVWMCKWAVGSKGKSTPISDVSVQSGLHQMKRPRRTR